MKKKQPRMWTGRSLALCFRDFCGDAAGQEYPFGEREYEFRHADLAAHLKRNQPGMCRHYGSAGHAASVCLQSYQDLQRRWVEACAQGKKWRGTVPLYSLSRCSGRTSSAVWAIGSRARNAQIAADSIQDDHLVKNARRTPELRAMAIHNPRAAHRVDQLLAKIDSKQVALPV